MKNYFETTNPAGLSRTQLERVAPSIYAEHEAAGLSDKYRFVSTGEVVSGLAANGFVPFSIRITKSNDPMRQGYTKHQIRFRQPNAQPIVALGGLVPEVILTNSHDGTSSYRLNGGAFRFVCFNGLITGFSFESFKVAHRGCIDGVVEGALQVVEMFPRMIEQALEWHSTRLTPRQIDAFGEAAIVARYGDDRNVVRPDQVTRALRSADVEPTLWNTFNRVQEHLTQGGLRTVSANGRRMRTRGVAGVEENTKLNRALWTLAERLHQGVRTDANDAREEVLDLKLD